MDAHFRRKLPQSMTKYPDDLLTAPVRTYCSSMNSFDARPAVRATCVSAGKNRLLMARRSITGFATVAWSLLLGLNLVHQPLMTNAQAQDHLSTAVAGETQLATLGGGCFWCVEAVFERFEGVTDVVSGYAGGHTPDPTYEQVCTDTTGHAEVVQIKFNPQQITYAQILDIFWEAHDPTTLNRQGADVGHHYRSIILYHDDKQKEIALDSKQKAAPRFKNPVVTEIVPLKAFHRAEEYHQDYFRKNPNAPYCMIVISPKLKKLEKLKLP
jgi:peptide-methionine (S)-S-oxide reductase